MSDITVGVFYIHFSVEDAALLKSSELRKRYINRRVMLRQRDKMIRNILSDLEVDIDGEGAEAAEVDVVGVVSGGEFILIQLDSRCSIANNVIVADLVLVDITSDRSS